MRKLEMTLIFGHIFPISGGLIINGAECHIGQIDPMILFLDNNLPDGLGLDHIQSIKAICSQVAIVLMTAGTAPNLKHQALSIGASQFISKPFSANLLFEIVNTLCPGLKAQDSLNFGYTPQ